MRRYVVLYIWGLVYCDCGLMLSVVIGYCIFGGFVYCDRCVLLFVGMVYCILWCLYVVIVLSSCASGSGTVYLGGCVL